VSLSYLWLQSDRFLFFILLLTQNIDLTVGNLPHHLDSSINHHLSLVTTRVSEQQQVIVKLYKRLNDLEESNSRIVPTVTGLQTAVSGLSLSLIAVEKISQDKKPLEAIEKKLEREISSVSREVSSVKGLVSNLERSSGVILSRMSAVEGRLPQPESQRK
jgi:hypothetical protein